MRSIGYGAYGDYGTTSFGDVESATVALQAAQTKRDALESGTPEWEAAQKDVTFAQQQLSAAQASESKTEGFFLDLTKNIIGGGLAIGSGVAQQQLGLKPPPSGAVPGYQAPGQMMMPPGQAAPKSSLGMAIGIAAGLGLLTVVIILATRK